MKSITFTISKGGVGKSLLTANVAASIAARNKKVILVEGDPNRPLQTIFGIDISSKDVKLDDVVKKNLEVQKAVYPTAFKNLFLIPSGVSLEGYFEMDPAGFARKLMDLQADFLFIDVPFPLGEAAFLSLGVCQYFIVILTEDEFVLCVESAIDTIRLAKYLLKCIPVGFILNRIKTPKKFNEEFIKDLEDLLEIPCLAKIGESPEISKSYGGVKSGKAFLAFEKYKGSEFAKEINKITDKLLSDLPEPSKKDPAELIKLVVSPPKT
jgi:septum site-determining protein MinD